MGWAARTWLAMTPEASYGVYDPDATPLWIRLHESNACTLRPRPLAGTIRSADGGNRRRQRIATRQAVTGRLRTLFYPSQAAALLGWAAGLADANLPSYTIDHWDSVRARRYLGCMVKGLTIRCAAGRDDGVASLEFDVVGQQPAPVDPTLPEPAPAALPAESPYTHQQTAGLLTLGGARSRYKSLQVAIRNYLIPTWDESPWITALYWGGRDVDLTVALQYLSAADRASFEAQAPLACQVAWSQAGSSPSVTLDFQGSNYLGDLVDDLPLDGAGYQTLTLQAFFDSTAATDLTLTVA